MLHAGDQNFSTRTVVRRLTVVVVIYRIMHLRRGQPRAGSRFCLENAENFAAGLNIDTNYLKNFALEELAGGVKGKAGCLFYSPVSATRWS